VCLVHSEGKSAHGGKGGEGWGRERVWEVAIEKSKSLGPEYFNIHTDIFGNAAAGAFRLPGDGRQETEREKRA